ncbi:hypothetical protein WMF31_00630 [Sorangium sp. So ce1036]|uniref:hypothetical protein n=1 Tax=Sorangium sp. So ce1036 TaxID=3133328 RepID=UPI003EFD5DDD
MREAVPGIVLAVVISGCTPDEERLFWTPPPDHAETISSTGGSEVCEPGHQIACDCPGGAPNGIQTCLLDGSGYGPCDGCGGQGGGGYSSATPSSSSSGDGGAGEAGSGGMGGGGSGGSGGAEPECTMPADCPGLDGACAWRTCEAGVCGREFAPAGPLAEQTPGDCRELQCDGSGGELVMSAPADVPDDGNECTVDACTATGPIHAPVPTGTACSAGLCQDRACVPYIPVQCETPEGIFIDCDGETHSYYIMWFTSPTTVTVCSAFPGGAGYCEPGVLCRIVQHDGSHADGTCI